MQNSARAVPPRSSKRRRTGSTSEGRGSRGAQPSEHEVAPLGQLERFGQELAVVVDEDTLLPEGLGEGVVLLLGL